MSRSRLGLFGDGWKRKALTELTQALGIEDRVCFFGWAKRTLVRPGGLRYICFTECRRGISAGFDRGNGDGMCVSRASDGKRHATDRERNPWHAGGSVGFAKLCDRIARLIECGPAARAKMGLAAAERLLRPNIRASERLPRVLSALGIVADFVPEFRLRKLEFTAG